MPVFAADRGYFDPEALDKLKTAYDEIVNQEWFDATPENRDDFARHVIATVRGDDLDQKNIKQLIEMSARMFYSRDV